MRINTRLPLEIISVDSALIYRGMDIGTAKPDAQTLARAPHHLIDILDPIESYSAAQFCEDVLHHCQLILARGKMPLLVGGTMMYFRALQQGLSSLPTADACVRLQLQQELAQYGLSVMYERLRTIDPITALRIHAHDAQRIQRALEVYLITGRPLSSLFSEQTRISSYQFINLQLMPSSRALLHARIEARFADMLADGLIDEVKRLLQQWPLTAAHPSMRSVGYRQVLEHLNGEYDEQTLYMKGVAATRQLAKRQLTWLRHWPSGISFDSENPMIVDELYDMIRSLTS